MASPIQATAIMQSGTRRLSLGMARIMRLPTDRTPLPATAVPAQRAFDAPAFGQHDADTLEKINRLHLLIHSYGA